MGNDAYLGDNMASESHSQVSYAIPWTQFSAFITALPLFSFVSCVLIAVGLHFDGSTRTHCRVRNYLPSISAAIGGYMPEVFIWRVGIALHSLPRIVFYPYICYKQYQNTPSGRTYNSTTWWFKKLNLLSSALHIVENGALLTLTYVSSTENYDVHEGSFVVFIACSMCYMAVTCILFKLTASQPLSQQESSVLRWRIGIMLFHFGSFGVTVYFFFRHNWYCEPGMYTLFALCEYFTVVSNILFHWHCQWPLRTANLTLSFGVDDLQGKRKI